MKVVHFLRKTKMTQYNNKLGKTYKNRMFLRELKRNTIAIPADTETGTEALSITDLQGKSILITDILIGGEYFAQIFGKVTATYIKETNEKYTSPSKTVEDEFKRKYYLYVTFADCVCFKQFNFPKLFYTQSNMEVRLTKWSAIKFVDEDAKKQIVAGIDSVAYTLKRSIDRHIRENKELLK